ncbi:GntR family transcriptional regulator [Bacillaceae bacterium S4-13-56]
MTQLKSKVYEDVLKRIQYYIKQENLAPGDKILSERELSEQLKVSRSSIREALRAMQLLGLIETRRGKGTFLRAYRPYYFIETLASFILTEGHKKKEIKEIKKMIEKEVAKKVAKSFNLEIKDHLYRVLQQDDDQIHLKFFLILFSKINNELLLTIWKILNEFYYVTNQEKIDKSCYDYLLSAIQKDQEDEIELAVQSMYA